MEQQFSPLTWAYYFQQEGVEEFKQSFLYSTVELEAAVIAAHEEISRKDEEILQLKGLLAKIIKERDDFEATCQKFALEKQLVSQIQSYSSKHKPDHDHDHDRPVSSGTTTNEDDNNTLCLSDCDDNIIIASSGSHVSLPLTIPTPSPTLAPQLHPVQPDTADGLEVKRSLPEQGKFLQAVMGVGPLLQTLLLAGPLPQWQHPPPQLSSGEIPPVTLSSSSSSPKSRLLHQDSCCHVSPTTSGGFTNKRVMLDNRELASDFDITPTSKYQNIC